MQCCYTVSLLLRMFYACFLPRVRHAPFFLYHSFGYMFQRDPTDSNRDIGMELPDNDFLPFKMRGTTCCFKSRSPEDDELESCRTFLVSDINHWDPTDEIFISSVGREQNPVCLPVCVCVCVCLTCPKCVCMSLIC